MKKKTRSFHPEEFELETTCVQIGHKELMNAITKGAPVDDIVTCLALEPDQCFSGRIQYQRDPYDRTLIKK